MTEFTPTTEKVRAAWASFREAQKGETWIFPFEQFERWLNTVKEKAWNEGFDSGHYVSDWESRNCDCRDNPYEQEGQE